MTPEPFTWRERIAVLIIAAFALGMFFFIIGNARGATTNDVILGTNAVFLGTSSSTNGTIVPPVVSERVFIITNKTPPTYAVQAKNATNRVTVTETERWREVESVRRVITEYVWITNT